MSEGVTEIVTETNDEIAAAKVFREIGPERIAEIDMAVSKWRSEGGFRDSNLTLSSFARRIMVNRTDVASYLTSIYGKKFPYMAFGYSRGGGKGTHGCTPRI